MLSGGEWSHYPKGLPCVETLKLVDKIWCREHKKDTMLLVTMKQMELLMSYVKGFLAKNCHVVQNYDDGYYGIQGWKNVQFVDSSSQGSTEVLPPHMESTLEVVLEKVKMGEAMGWKPDRRTAAQNCALNVPQRTGESPGKSVKHQLTANLAGRIMFQVMQVADTEAHRRSSSAITDVTPKTKSQ
ncbi:hypothetical protein HAX54_048306 [Datura stramonium]|uniref:Uncharacterized protein n=1 Tax=Datura stramonium TaxID=4076 RepID=A0ABS8SUD8_DATST|nr:hypothetical protein [Datura stramonium]